MNPPIEGRRILIVEDEFLIAILIQEMLEDAGYLVAGPVPRLDEALKVVEACDAAVLDVNLAGERIDPVADALARRRIPFVFVTGYAAGGVPDRHAGRPRVCKPFRAEDLIAALSDALKPTDA